MDLETCDRAICTVVRNAHDSAEVHLFLEIVGLDNDDLLLDHKSQLSEGFNDQGIRARMKKASVKVRKP